MLTCLSLLILYIGLGALHIVRKTCIVYVNNIFILCLLFACLFILQIDNEEYGEALSLAHAYNLDSDLVYQRQWRKSTVSIASIQDYLVRDGKRRRNRCEEMRRRGGEMVKTRER